MTAARKFPRYLLPAAALIAAAAGAATLAGMSRIEPLTMTSLRITDRNGLLLQEVASSEYGTAYPADPAALPPHCVGALLAAEDRRFFSHHGVDPLALGRALWQNLRAGRTVSGGSTITQQLVRTMDRSPRTLPYKAREAVRALAIELRYPKERILAEYLNRAPFGNGAYGVEAAARLYFGKPARDLSLAESAFLCAIPASNRLYNPYRRYPSALRRQKRILGRMYLRGMTGKDDYLFALREQLLLYPRRRSFRAPHFCAMARERARAADGEFRTTLDLRVQDQVEYVIDNHIARLRDGNVTNAAAVVIDNATGDILALAGSADFFDEQHQGQVNGATALRQPGSALKPFVYGLAFERGVTAADPLPDIRTALPVDHGGLFIPQNYDKKYHGMVRARTALGCSYNIATVNLAARLGAEPILAKLHAAGFDSLTKPAAHYGIGLALGNGEVTLLELARAYAGLARAGRLPELRMLAGDPRVDRGGFFEPRVAFLVTNILSDNRARTPAFGEFSPLNLPFPCAAKTGTSKNFRDNWTAGYTPRYTVAVWAGNFNGSAMHSVSGISGAAPIFRDIMLALELRNVPVPFPDPGGIEKRKICALSGGLPAASCTAGVEEIFVEGTAPRETWRVHRSFTVDRRTGRVAAPGCPDEEKGTSVFEIYPPEYYEWARSAGIPAPPAACEGPQERGDWYVAEPKNGDIFKIDPVLRREYQTVTLKPGLKDEGVTRVVWTVGDETITAGAYPFSAAWQLKPGRHRVRFSAFRGTGEAGHGGPVEITVMP